MDRPGREPGFPMHHPQCRRLQGLGRHDESSGKRPLPQVRPSPALNEEDAELASQDGHQDDIYGDRERGERLRRGAPMPCAVLRVPATHAVSYPRREG